MTELRHLVTRHEAALVRAIADGRSPRAGDPDGRLWQPSPGEAIAVVEGSGRSSCRECGETIEKGALAVTFGFDAYGDPNDREARSWAHLVRAYVHAAPCRTYPEEE